MQAPDRETWSKLVFDKLVEADVTLFSYVPDFGNTDIIKMADEHNETRTVLLTSEEEGVAVCAGVDLVGQRGVVCMQSSGVGNCPNYLSLVKGGRFPDVNDRHHAWRLWRRKPLAVSHGPGSHSDPRSHGRSHH